MLAHVDGRPKSLAGLLMTWLDTPKYRVELACVSSLVTARDRGCRPNAHRGFARSITDAGMGPPRACVDSRLVDPSTPTQSTGGDSSTSRGSTTGPGPGPGGDEDPQLRPRGFEPTVARDSSTRVTASVRRTTHRAETRARGLAFLSLVRRGVSLPRRAVRRARVNSIPAGRLGPYRSVARRRRRRRSEARWRSRTTTRGVPRGRRRA